MKNNDDFFIYKIKMEKDDRASYILFTRYKMLARKFAAEMFRMYHQPGIMQDDFYSIALENYFRCLNRYVVGKNTFYPYWRRISHHASLKYVISIARFNRPNSFSLDSPVNQSKKDTMTYGDVVGEDDEHIVGDINRKTFVSAIRENDEIGLSPEEKKVVAEVSNFVSFSEIAKKLDKTEAHIRYVFRTAKSKLAKLKDTNK